MVASDLDQENILYVINQILVRRIYAIHEFLLASSKYYS
jgi:hypothetical protein